MKKRVCAAAVCAAFSLSAFAQSALDQARTAAGMAAIDRAQSTGFLAGLDRAMKTPLEIVWLRAAAEESLWNDPGLSRTSTVGRTAWRYVFGGNAQFAPRPNEIARLVVSTLNLPQGPVNAGRLDLTGTGRLYLVTPEAPSATPPDRLAMILAAGSTLHISDATSPSIHIELKAPENRPLLLGNLATSDIGKVLALLVKPGSASAFEASVDLDGKVALRAGGEVQLAALLPGPGAADLRIEVAQQRKPPVDQVLIASLSPALPSAPTVDARKAGRPSAPQLARDFSSVAAGLESPVKSAGFEPIVVASLAPAVDFPAERRAAVAATRYVPVDLRSGMDKVALVMQTGFGTEATLVASLSPRDAQPLIVRSVQPGRTEAPAERQPELAQVAVAVTAPAAAEGRERALVASLAPISMPVVTAAAMKARSTRMETVGEIAMDAALAAATTERPSSVEHTIVASTAIANKARPVQVAALAPATGTLEFKASPAPSTAAAEPKSAAAPDLARMRAEVEAEIARERERLAAQFKPQVIGAPAPKRFVLGV
jgi:hypothetical protein